MKLDCPNTGIITWKQLNILIMLMDDEQRNMSVCVSDEDGEYFDVGLCINKADDILVPGEPYLVSPYNKDKE